MRSRIHTNSPNNPFTLSKMNNKYLLLLLSLFLFSCTNKETEFIESNEHVDVTIDIEDMEWDVQTRTSAEITSSGIKFSWSAKDTIGVYPDEGSQVEFLAQASTGSVSTASFDGGAWELKDGHTFKAFYPFKYQNRTCDNIELVYSGQTQTGNNNLSGACNKDYIYAPNTSVEKQKANFSFKHLGAFVYLQISLPDAGSYKTVSLITDKKVIPTKQRLDLTSGTPKLTTETKVSKFSLSLKSVKLASADEVLSVAMFLPAIDLSSRTVSLQVTSSAGQIYESRQPLDLKQLAQGKAYRREVSMKRQGEDDPVTSADINFLSFGNSPALDAFAYVPSILQELMPTANINIGFAYKGGGSLAQNWNYIEKDQEVFTYYYYKTGEGAAWQNKEYERKFTRCLEYTDWDYIAFHQVMESSNDYSSCQPSLDNIIAKVQTEAPKSTPVWIMNHSYANGYDNATYGSSAEMYSAIAAVAQSVADNTSIKKIIPSGTAIENARQSSLASLGEYISADGKTKGQLTFDGDHLQPGLPMLVASYAIAQYILDLYGVDLSIKDSKFKVSVDDVSTLNIPTRTKGKVQTITEEDYAIAKQCALNAIVNPYKTTK